MIRHYLERGEVNVSVLTLNKVLGVLKRKPSDLFKAVGLQLLVTIIDQGVPSVHYLKVYTKLKIFILFYVLFVGLITVHAQSNYTTPYSVSTIAGGSSNGISDGQGVNARFSGRMDGIAADSSGNLYVSDSLNNTIRKGSFLAEWA